MWVIHMVLRHGIPSPSWAHFHYWWGIANRSLHLDIKHNVPPTVTLHATPYIFYFLFCSGASCTSSPVWQGLRKSGGFPGKRDWREEFLHWNVGIFYPADPGVYPEQCCDSGPWVPTESQGLTPHMLVLQVVPTQMPHIRLCVQKTPSTSLLHTCHEGQ